MNNNPSQSSVSDLLSTLHACNEEINDTILIGEKVAMIEEAATIFHQIKAVITPEYLTDDEFKWIEGVAKSWNNEVLTYRMSQSNGNANANVASKPNISPQKHLEDMFNDALNDMISNGDFDDAIDNLFEDDSEQDNGGFDGGDGIW